MNAISNLPLTPQLRVSSHYPIGYRSRNMHQNIWVRWCIPFVDHDCIWTTSLYMIYINNSLNPYTCSTKRIQTNKTLVLRLRCMKSYFNLCDISDFSVTMSKRSCIFHKWICQWIYLGYLKWNYCTPSQLVGIIFGCALFCGGMDYPMTN